MKTTYESNSASEIHFDELMKGVGVAPSLALRDRAESLAQGFIPAKRRASGWKWAAAFAFLLVVAVVVSPRAYAGVILHRAGEALDEVTSATVTFRTRVSGNIVLRYFYDHGRWRIEQPGREVSIFRDGHMWTYRQDLNLISTKEADSPFEKGFDSFKLSEILKDMQSGDPQVESAPPIGGRDMIQVSIINTPVQEKTILTVDKEANLPVRMDTQKPIHGAWQTVQTADFQYNRPPSDSLFEPNFPKTAVDESVAKSRLIEKFKDVVATIGDHRLNPIAIRKVDLNSRGHVFIAFTGSGVNIVNRHMWVKDDRGIEYLRGQLAVGGTSSDFATPTDLIIGRHRVLLQWWVPSRPVTELPHRLIVRTTSGNDNRETGRVEIPVSGQTVSVVPAYLHFLDGSIKDDLELRLEEFTKQMGYAMAILRSPDGKLRSMSDNSGMPCYVTSGAGFNHDPQDLAFALRQGDQALSICDQIAARDGSVMSGARGQILFNRYEILKKLGRAGEAQESLREAEDVDPGSHYEKQAGFSF